MDKKDAGKILHALNTFPKAFFVWGILDQRPQRPVEMDEKLREAFPYLCEFTFLNRKKFAQYCQRSLKGIVVKDYSYWEYNRFQKEVPTWQLIDESIQPIAGFLLAKCIEIGVNCEYFLASRKNSSSLSNLLGIRILERLYKNERSSVYELANYLLDPTSVDRNLLKLMSNNLVAYEAPSSNSKIRKRMVKNTIAKITQGGRMVFEEILKPIVLIMNGKPHNDKIFRETEPAEEDLIKAMEMYAKNLEHSSSVR
ncbi:MAG: hypothetical protein JRI94_04725 [Deltaproteobacteria bacterium]|nr:hypothetical protein [Deltaproteobacteria bacterium]